MAIPITPVLPQGGYNKTATPASPDSSGIDMRALLAAFAAQAQSNAALGPQRLQQQNDALFGRHLGTGGGEVTPSNPTGNAANPWATDGLFHGGFAAQMDPKSLAMSQGNTAVNQWRMPNLFHGMMPSGQDNATAAIGASPQPKPVSAMPTPAPLTGPSGNAGSDAANLAQNFSMYRPGGMGAPPPAPKTNGLRKGSSFNMFGASGSPRPGFRAP